jgi:acyl carrier protein
MLTVFQHLECFICTQREHEDEDEDEDLTLDARFVEDLGFDSLDTVDLIAKCEQTFGIEMPDEEVEQLLTVGALVEYLEARLPPPGGEKRPDVGEIEQRVE